MLIDGAALDAPAGPLDELLSIGLERPDDVAEDHLHPHGVGA